MSAQRNLIETVDYSLCILVRIQKFNSGQKDAIQGFIQDLNLGEGYEGVSCKFKFCEGVSCKYLSITSFND